MDEVHALAGTKRGAHLALSLERLSAITRREPQRIGLSATAQPLSLVARFLGGDREVTIVDSSQPPSIDLEIRVPVRDMTNPLPRGGVDDGGVEAENESESESESENGAETEEDAEKGMWPVIVPQLLALIREHTSTILFVNSRGLCERLCQRLNDMAGQALVRAHHGSLAHRERTVVEGSAQAR